jgi:hypothetical protein
MRLELYIIMISFVTRATPSISFINDIYQSRALCCPGFVAFRFGPAGRCAIIPKLKVPVLTQRALFDKLSLFAHEIFYRRRFVHKNL